MDGKSGPGGMYLLSHTTWYARADDSASHYFWREKTGASLHDTLVSLASSGVLQAKYDEHEDGGGVWTFLSKVKE